MNRHGLGTVKKSIKEIHQTQKIKRYVFLLSSIMCWNFAVCFCSQTGRAFFHKYPELYQFLLTELEMATQDLGSVYRFLS